MSHLRLVTGDEEPQLADLLHLATPEQLERIKSALARKKEAKRAAEAREHLLPFILYTKPDYLHGWFHERLCRALEWFEAEVRAGNRPRLILEAPPQNGKTEVVTRRAPVWMMARNPTWQVVCASYNKDLADDNSRDAREIARDDAAHEVFPAIRPDKPRSRYYADFRRQDVDQVDNWKIGNGASYKAAGVGTALSGRRATVVIIDDPFKDRQEADSPPRRELVKKWFTSTASSRLAPGGGIIIMATRWHEQDLTGAVLEAAQHGGDKWVRLSFPAVAEHDEYAAGCPWDDYPDFPDDPAEYEEWFARLGPDEAGPPLLRRAGEALFDRRYSLDELRAIEAALHSLGRGRDWDSLYQQRPVPEGGNRIRREWFAERYDCEPVDLAQQADEVWITVDAAKKARTTSDFHSLQVWALHRADPARGVKERRYCLDRIAGQMEYPQFERTLDGLIDRWSPALREKGGALIEDTANGTTYLQVRGPSHLGVSLVAFHPSTDTPGSDRGKGARAVYLERAGESRAIVLPSPARAPWVEDMIAWWVAFPLGSHDDDVDAASQLMMRWTLEDGEGDWSVWDVGVAGLMG